VSDHPLDLRRLRHDLRTPVNHILGYCEMLIEDESVPSRFADDLDKIRKGGHRLLNLISEYLSDDSFDPAHFELSKVSHDLRTPVNLIIGYCDLIADQADESTLGGFLADLSKIRSAAQDWLTRMESCLIVPAKPGETEPDRLSATARRQPRGGALAPRRRKKTLTQPLVPAGVSVRLLVVDDDQASADLLARWLRKQGVEVVVASNGKAALEILGSQTFNGVLLDFVMPEIDGLALLRRLRRHHSMTELPVIMVTGKDSSLDVVAAMQMGANDYVTKPVDFEVVMARLATHLRLQQAQIELQKRMDEIRRLAKDLETRNEFIRQAFGRYVTDEVVFQLLETPQGLQLGGETRVVTVLMSDLRGFTMLAERYSPEKMVATLNEYLGAMTEIISQYHGTISEFIGDAIMAIFGAPNRMEDHPAKALACALSMQLAMDQVNRKLQGLDLPALEMGIGINTGAVIAGNIGSVKRAKYGVVGSPVNLTGRIQSACVGGEILAAEATIEGLRSRLILRDAITLNPKGVSSPTTLHSVAGFKDQPELCLPAEKFWWADSDAPELPVECFLITGEKSAAAESFNSRLKLLSDRTALLSEVHCDLIRRSDLKLRFPAGQHMPEGFDLYAKIMECIDPAEVYRIQFVSRPPQLEQLLANLRQSSS
jgi:adenylate cyclase